MAKTEAAKRAEMMRKEWWKSKSTEATINDLIGLGVLHTGSLQDGGQQAVTATPIPSLVR
jgi:hypothetical protein